MNFSSAEFLFNVDDESRMIDNSREKLFHTFVAKALFATKRSRPDIHTAVAFLTTRARGPNKDDWNLVWAWIIFTEVLNHILDVWDHRDFDFTFTGVV